jgi:hypothetical protein
MNNEWTSNFKDKNETKSTKTQKSALMKMEYALLNKNKMNM